MKPLLPFLLFFALLSPPATAQFLRTTIIGRIERAPAGACDATATHRAACTDVLLKSSTVALGTLVGKTVEMEGAIQLGQNCVTIDVATATDAAQRISTISLTNYRIGTNVIFTTVAPAGSVVPLIFAGALGFAPLGQLGSYLLDPLTSIVFSWSVSIGVAIHTVQIPDEASLVGLVPVFQSAWLQVAPLGGGFVNADCFRITGR